MGSTKDIKVLISGASIAGPALALWLEQYGFSVTIVEKAPELRRGGQAVDFKGATHRLVLERMGILGDILKFQVENNGDGIIVDNNGRKIGICPAEFSRGEIEIMRGDLSRIIYDRTATKCNYLFNDSITSLTETQSGVEVGFQNSESRIYDFVVGADGIHSNVRRLAFGPEVDYVRYLGYYYALVNTEVEVNHKDAMYNEPGRMVIIGGSKAPSFFVFESREVSYDREDIAGQKRVLINAYHNIGWIVPELMKQVPESKDFYLDSISRVKIDSYSKGRVVLLGDSAYGNTLGGFGTGLAIVGAYVLAGELYRAKGDYKTAFAQYEHKFRDYAKVSEKVNGGSIMAPSTRLGIYLRNRMFSVAALFTGVMKIFDRFATNITLEDYSRNN